MRHNNVILLQIKEDGLICTVKEMSYKPIKQSTLEIDYPVGKISKFQRAIMEGNFQDCSVLFSYYNINSEKICSSSINENIPH